MYDVILYFLLPAWLVSFVVAQYTAYRNREPIPSLLGPGPEPLSKDLEARKPINLGLVGCIIFIPLLSMAALLSHPYMLILRLVQKRKEARFADQMTKAGRAIRWEDVKRSALLQAGTLIYEVLSPKGPTRLWWTADVIADMSPFRFVESGDKDHICYEEEFWAFGEWCFKKYTHPSHGKGLLVEPPSTDHKVFWREAREVGYVASYWPAARNE